MNKNIFKKIICVAFSLVCLFSFIGCAEPITDVKNKSQLSNPTVAAWYKVNDKDALDTYINIDFNQIDITQIHSIKFFLYKGTKLLGTALSQGENLENLLTQQQKYWLNTGDYSDTTGVQTLSCAFMKSKKKSDDEMWERTACYVEYPETPNYLKAYVVVRENKELIRYTVSNNKYKEQ